MIDAAERTLKAPRTIAGWDLPGGDPRLPRDRARPPPRGPLSRRPAEFRPERFLDERAESYTWLPFGGGIRRCIGAALAQAEMAEVLRVVVSRVELAPVRPEPEPVVLRGITLAPKHGARVRVVAVRARSERHDELLAATG